MSEIDKPPTWRERHFMDTKEKLQNYAVTTIVLSLIALCGLAISVMLLTNLTIEQAGVLSVIVFSLCALVLAYFATVSRKDDSW